MAELKQTKPFAFVEAEAFVALLKTVDHVRRTTAAVLQPHQLTEQQYNVLRILRGAGKSGLPTLSVAERLIEQTPGITRLIDRLEAKMLVRRERPEQDRRQVYCFITENGLELLDKLDPEMDGMIRRVMKNLDSSQVQELLNFLEKIRDAE
jgi:MarR family transcriptional regulator, organic hydroperoxide resistance regulator